ncbi:uncharacterized protein LOC143085594 isoform X2 [Mytilus galloprovincialis]|uniref:uncharacterized protein LOC143085594 isoform X2 n=1 Tax=Mytilus galloprovincialis TaxID=29158 RepID=UPI003F7C9A36
MSSIRHICYNCADISHPRFCNHVEQCNIGQVCSLKRVVDIYGETSFNQGCTTIKLCQAKMSLNETGKCTHCCSSDLCNSDGCGEQAPKQQNGTLCYQCNGKLQSESCQKVTFCGYDEMCHISEESWNGEIIYRSGCKDNSKCARDQYPYPILGRRNYRTMKRVRCCNFNLCNERFQSQTLTIQPVKPDNTVYVITAEATTYTTKGYPTTPVLHKDSQATDFILLFPDSKYYEHAQPKVFLTSSDSEVLSAFEFGSHANQNFSLIRDKTEYLLDQNVLMTDGLKQAGLQLYGRYIASVYGFILNPPYYQHHYSDGYLAIPTRYLGTTYIIHSFQNLNSRNVITLSPTKSYTSVTVNLKISLGFVKYNNKQYFNGDNITVIVNKYETFQISLNATSDLTGTMVISSDPIAVVSGSKCDNTSYNIECNPMIEMVLPIDQLDIAYIIPYINIRPDSVVRLLSVNDTLVTVQSKYSNNVTRQIKGRQFYDFPHNEVSCVTASDDISVIIYPQTFSNEKGDAFMMTIPGINQYLPYYHFVVPEGFLSYISITVIAAEFNDFLLDGHTVISADKVYTLVSGMFNYSSFTKPISSGEHTLKHRSGMIFGLWVYGSVGYDAYGYPAGMYFRQLNNSI